MTIPKWSSREWHSWPVEDIVALQAERDRYKAALRRVRDCDLHSTWPGYCFSCGAHVGGEVPEPHKPDCAWVEANR